jgi:hypothetical protein
MKAIRFFQLLIISACILTVVTGCNRSDQTDTSTSSTDKPQFSLSNIATHVDNGKPVINAIVTNTDETVHSLSAVVQVLKNNVVIDTATANLSFPINDGAKRLERNQSAALEAVFNNIANHNQYDSRRITYTWKEDNTEIHTSSSSKASEKITIIRTQQDEF